MSELKKIGAVITLDGEKDYRKALSDIKTDQKLLRSEMELAKSQYDKNGESVDGLKKKHDILKDSVDKQKEKVDLLKDAVEKATEKYGENDKKVGEWKTQLNYAETDLNNLNKELEDNDKKLDDAEKGMKDAEKATDDFGKEMDDTGGKSKSFKDTLKENLTVTDVINGLKTAGGLAKAAWDEVYAIARDAAAYADDILTISTNTGIATTTLQQLKAAEPYIDVPLSNITDAIGKNTKAMGEARDGSKKYQEAYEKLGVKVQEQDGTLRNSEDVFWDVVDALGGIENKTERDTLSMDLFGRKASDLTGLINSGREGLEEYTAKAEAMALILDDKALATLSDMDDSFNALDQSVTSLKDQVALVFAPVITEVVDTVSGFIGDAAKWISEFGDEYTGELQEIHEKSEGLVEDLTTSKENFDSQKDSIEENAEYVNTLADNIFKLGEKSSLTATEQELLKMQISELNGLVPDLNLQYDEQTGKLNMTRSEVDSLTESYKKQAIQMAYQEQMTELAGIYAEALRNNAKAQKEYDEAVAAGGDAVSRYNELFMQFYNEGQTASGAATDALNNLTDAEYEQYTAIEASREVRHEANGVLVDAQNAMSDLETEMDGVFEAMGITKTATEESTEATEANTEATDELTESAEEAVEELSALDQAIADYAEQAGLSAEDVKSSFEEMRDAFVDAYKSAESSIDGQVGLFKELSTETTTTDQKMLDNLLNQNVTLEQWSADIQALAKAGLEDGLLQQLIDAGPAGAADVRQLAQHIGDETDTFIDDMNTAYREQMKIKEAFATEMAESETHFLEYSDSIGVDAETLRKELAAKGVEIGDDYSTSMADSINKGAPDVTGETEDIAKDTAEKAEKFEKAGIDSAERYVTKVKKILEDSIPGIGLKLGDVAKLFRTNGDTIEKRGQEGGEKYVNAIKTEITKTTEIENKLNAIVSLASARVQPMTDAGSQMAHGVINGLVGTLNARYWEVDQAVARINTRARQAMRIQSPSKVMMETGSYIGEGLIEGTVESIDEGLSDITRETERLSDTLGSGLADGLNNFRLPDLTLGGTNSPGNTINDTTNYGGVNINVYGAEGQSEQRLAEIVVDIITDRERMAAGVW